MRSSLDYGARVQGITDKELASNRTIAAKGLRPLGRGRSLSKLLAIHVDLCWRSGVAPILACAEEVWLGLDGVDSLLRRLSRAFFDIRISGPNFPPTLSQGRVPCLMYRRTVFVLLPM